MAIYHLIAKHSEELDCKHVTFTASDAQDAERKAYQWNRYHGHAPSPGWGWQVAELAPVGTEPQYDYMFKHQVN
jgi:hypothetical protein